MSLAKVEIRYCADCGYGHEALSLARILMDKCDTDLAEIKIVPWVDGSYDVLVDGELVHSMFRDGGFADPNKVIEAVRTRAGQ